MPINRVASRNENDSVQGISVKAQAKRRFWLKSGLAPISGQAICGELA
jgi:hypothetical protein